MGQYTYKKRVYSPTMDILLGLIRLKYKIRVLDNHWQK